jgi:peroxiredoxin
MTAQTKGQEPRWPWKIVAILIVIAAIATAGYFALYAKTPAPNVGFTEITGKQISMEDLRGKVVMVNFWATSCVTCIKEMPEFVRTYNKYNGKGLDFIAVAMDYDPPNYVLNYAKTRELPFRVALDTKGDIARAFGDVKLTPTTFVIDKRGNVLKRYLGEPDFAELHQLLEKALAA